MSKLALAKTTSASVTLTADRAYRLTPEDDCSVNIGSAAGQLPAGVSSAQLRSGRVYTFYPTAVDRVLTGLTGKISADTVPSQLDYIDTGVKPAPVGVPKAAEEGPK